MHKLLVFVFITALSSVSVTAQEAPKPERPEKAKKAQRVYRLALAGTGGFLGVELKEVSGKNFAELGLSKVRGVAVSRVIKDSAAEKARRKERSTRCRRHRGNNTKPRKAPNENKSFGNSFSKTKKCERSQVPKTDERVETKEEFETGLYLSRSRIVQAEGGTNPDNEDIDAADEHILFCIKKPGVG